MSYIEFKQNQLVNLEYALSKELLRANACGSFSCTTLLYCNTRKYHGLLICPQPNIDTGHHVLLSSVDESVEQQGNRFNFGLHRFKGSVYSPRGHKYLSSLELVPTPKMRYRVGGVVFTKEILFVNSSATLIIKYTLEDAHSPTTLLVSPLMAFRNIHALSKANGDVDTSYQEVVHGISTGMYPGYSRLYMQFSKDCKYLHRPDWYYDFEYPHEQERGYDYHEDLYAPGYFEMPIQKGESVYFAIGLDEISRPQSELRRCFEAEQALRIPRDSFDHCLLNSAKQFIHRQESTLHLVNSFPWFTERLRDTWIALPGLSLDTDHPELCIEMLQQYNSERLVQQALTQHEYDSPLWYIWALQCYGYQKSKTGLWKQFGGTLRSILEFYQHSSREDLWLNASGLIGLYSCKQGLTWMNAQSEGYLMTPRNGVCVEINALWYNAIGFCLELAKAAKDRSFVEQWEGLFDLFPERFKQTFWNKELGYLADVVEGDRLDFSIRPNQAIAAGLPYSPLSTKIRQLVLNKVSHDLLTPRGLRSLSPTDPNYENECVGNEWQRQQALHQGSVYIWPLQFYAQGVLAVFGQEGLSQLERLYQGFEPAIIERGIGCLSELYDADAPHLGRGAISNACSVAAMLRLRALLASFRDSQTCLIPREIASKNSKP